MNRKLLILACALLSVIGLQAQDQPEYRLEVGAGAGLMTYVGDLSGSPFRGMKPMGALLAKYKSNPRMAWTLNFGYGQVSASSATAKTWLPDLQERPMEVKSGVYDVQTRFEYNFWPFGTGREYHGAQRLTPFIAFGLGLTVCDAKVTQPGADMRKESTVALQVPIGVGVKYKLAERLNLSAEWMMHFAGTDRIDGLADPYGIRSQGLFKNTDGYSTLQVSLTYDLWAKCPTCHNDRD